MNKATFPGVCPSNDTNFIQLLELDKNHIDTAVTLGDMRKDIGDVIISYIDKYLYYAQS